MPFVASSSETPAGAVRTPRGARPRAGSVGGVLATAGFLCAAVCAIVLCGGAAASAQTTDRWTATMTVGSSTTDSTAFGWSTGPLAYFSDGNLTDTEFQRDGATWELGSISLVGSELTLDFETSEGQDPADLRPLVFHVDSDTFSLQTATFNAAERAFAWPNSGLSWSAGDTIELKLTETVTTSEPQPQPEPTARLPGRPSNLEVTSRGPARHDLTWDAPRTDGGSAITGYRIQVRRTGRRIWRTLERNTRSTETAWSHTGIAGPGRFASYRVAAINRHGVGEPSPPVKAPAPDPTPVPALPLAGVVVLGALLAAGGRARLGRRRRLC